ncbi:MAG: NosD domain-containing protein [Thermoplasmatota archaeon]
MKFEKILVCFIVSALIFSVFGVAIGDTVERDNELEKDDELDDESVESKEVDAINGRDVFKTSDGQMEIEGNKIETTSSLKSIEGDAFTSSYTTHEPIKIDDDTDLNQMAMGEGWAGTGSEENPYIIEGYDIDAYSYGYAIYIGNTTDHFVVRDSYLHNAHSYDRWEEAGLQLYNITNGVIKDNEIRDNDYYGIYLEGSTGITIFNNTVSSYSWSSDGIYLTDSDDNILDDNTVSSNGDYGVYLSSSNSNILRNNTVSDSDYAGVYIYNSDETTLENNTVSSNYDEGINLYNSDYTILENNTVSYNQDYGIYLRYSEGITLKNTELIDDGILIKGSSTSYWTSHDIDLTNTVNRKPVRFWKNRTSGTVPTDTGQVILANSTGVTVENQNIDSSSVGILLGLSTEITVKNNTVSDNDDGIYLYYSDNNILEDNTADSNRKGLNVDNSDNNLLENNSFSFNTDDGIFLYSSESNVAYNNNLSSNTDGFYLSYSDSNTLVNNTISSSSNNGIESYISDNNIMENNTVSFSVNYGIYLRYSKGYELKNTAMIDDGILMDGSNIDYWNTHDIDTSNTVNGRPVRYWNNRTGGDMPADTGQVILANSTGVTVENKKYDNSSIGILLGFSDNNDLLNNTLYSNDDGIYVYFSEDNLVKNNTAGSNRKGVYMYNSHFNTLANNSLYSNENYGLELYSSDSNRIENNDISSNNGHGANIRYSGSNTIENNKIDSNSGYGIYFYYHSQNNLLMNNDISLNNYGVYLYSSSSNEINNNNIFSNNNYGIYSSYSSNVIENNTIESNGYYGVYFYRSNSNYIGNNTISSNYYSGIYIRYSDSNILKKNTVTSNGGDGVYFYSSDGNDIENNTIDSNGYDGIYLGYSGSNTVLDNTISSNTGEGIYLYSSDDNALDDNTITANNDEGVYFSNSENNDMKDNTISLNDYGGVKFSDSRWNVLKNNTVLENSGTGILLYSSTDNNTIYHNNIMDNVNQGEDQGENNTWFSENLKEGNYWSDYTGIDEDGDGVGETNYSKIDGSAGSNDTYPLINAIGDDEAPSLDADNSPDSATAGADFTFDITASDNLKVRNVNVSWEHDTSSGNLALNDNGDETWDGTIVLDGSLNDLTYGVQVNDSGGNYVRGLQQTVSITEDDEYPSITDTTVGDATTGEMFNVTAGVTDNVEVDTVWLEYTLTSEEGYSSTYNNTMDHASDYWYNVDVWNNATNLEYTIAANDTWNNWNSTTEGLVVTDNDDPSLDGDYSPVTGTTGDTYTFDITASDNIEVTSVNASWSHGELSGNLALTDDGDGTWSGTISLDDSLSDMDYRVQINDTSGNYVMSDQQIVSISDNDDPTLDADNSPVTWTTGDTYTFDITASDNIEVTSVNASWSHDSLSGNLALTDDGDGTWSGTITLDDDLSDMTYKVQVNDTSGNYVRGDEQAVTIDDDDDPSLSDNSPDQGYASYDLQFKVTVTDNIEVGSVNVSWSHGSLSGNLPLTDTDNDDVWEGSITLDDSKEELTYTIQANDTSGNSVLSSEQTVTVLDSDKPLRIDDDSELAAESTSGAGTEAHPYVIENLDINGYGRGYGIYIGNTTDHFVVRGNTLYNASGNGYRYFRNSGLYLYNVTNGSVEDNTVYGNIENGILLESSSDNTILKNNVSYNRVGIQLIDTSNRNVIRSNTLSGNNDAGIYITSSTNNTVDDNNVSSSQYGIYIESSSGNDVTNNFVTKSSYYAIALGSAHNNLVQNNNASKGNNLGFLLQYSDNNTVINNTALENQYGLGLSGAEYNVFESNDFSNNKYGIYGYQLRYNTFFKNTVDSNLEIGIYFHTSTENNTIYHNDILNNTQQAFDDGTGNQWYNATLQEGNYWSDYNGTDQDGDGVGETNYTGIDGGAGSNDIYPLTIPNNDDQSPSLDEDNSPVNGTTGDLYTFNITASDDFEVGSVNVSWTHGSISGNVALTYDGNGTWSGSITLDDSLSDMIYRVQVNDTSGNYVRGSKQTVAVEDNDDPILEADNSPNTGTTGDEYTFDITASDNIEVESVNVTWSHGDLSGKLALTDDGDGTWSGIITLDNSLDDLTYEIEVNDTSGNSVRGSEQTVTLTDDDIPTLDTDDSPDTGTTGDTFDFDISASDNIAVSSVNVSWSHGSANGNKALTLENGHWIGNVTLDDALEDLTYQVQVNDTSGNHMIGGLQNVTVSDVYAPTADAGSDIHIDEDTQITLDGSDSSDNVGIVSYTWTIDGDEFDGEMLDHMFDQPGDYNVKLNVTDETGNYDTDTVDVTVFDITAPTAEIDSDNRVDEDDPITFDGSESTDNVGIISYEWDLGNGEYRTGEQISYTYEEPGIYVVNLTVTDESDNYDTDTITVYVEDTTEPNAEPGEDITITVTEEFTLDGSDSSDNVNIYSYEWDLGDGEIKTGKQINYTFDEVGNYTIELTVTDEAGNDNTDTLNITVKEKFEFSELRTDIDDTFVGKNVELMIDVTNTGDEIGEYTIEFLIDGEVVGTDTVEIGPGETKTASYTHTIEKIGDLRLEAGGQTSTILVKEQEDRSKYLPLFFILLLLIGLSLVIALLILKRSDITSRDGTKDETENANKKGEDMTMMRKRSEMKQW